MAKNTVPVIDHRNPCYCPAIPAQDYLYEVRNHKPRRQRTKLDMPSFDDRLRRLLKREDASSGIQSSPRQVLGVNLRHPSSRFSSSSTSWLRDSSTGDEHWHDSLFNPAGETGFSFPDLKRKYPYVSSSDSFGDLLGPPKRVKSSLSLDESSFILSGKMDSIHYSDAIDSLESPGFFAPYSIPTDQLDAALRETLKYNTHNILTPGSTHQDELQAFPIGPETPHSLHTLLSRLEARLPDIRLYEKFTALDNMTHQGILDILATTGLLNAEILRLFQASSIESINLSTSVFNPDGFNLGGQDIWRVLGRPNSFLCLSKLQFNGARISDFDLTRIHHLPRLAILVLEDTGIGNEAIFHIASLKHTLAELYLTKNPRIDDDAVPALILLQKLHILRLRATSIGMGGIRRLAATLYDEERDLDIEIPAACMEYINSIQSQYMLFPVPPLITDPTVCASLSIGALKRNLSGHAMYNPSIVTSGTQVEMVERLKRILEIRKEDLLVRAKFGRDSSSDEAASV